jgi:hypothetical protein
MVVHHIYTHVYFEKYWDIIGYLHIVIYIYIYEMRVKLEYNGIYI